MVKLLDSVEAFERSKQKRELARFLAQAVQAEETSKSLTAAVRYEQNSHLKVYFKNAIILPHWLSETKMTCVSV